MATLRRAGFGSVFEVENEKVGIGTTGTATNTLQVLGDIKSSDAKILGISTLTTYQGFVDKEARFGKEVIDVESQAGTLGEVIIEGDVTVSSASTLTSSVNQLTLTDSFSVPSGNTDSRIHCHTAGSMRFNEDLGTLEFYTGDEWRTVNSYKDTGNRGRGVMGGRTSEPTHQQVIGFITIATRGNEQDFGELTESTQYSANGATSSSTRGLNMGGSGPAYKDVISYVTIASKGNAIDFGNLTDARHYGAGMSSSTRAIVAGGYDGSSHINIIDYVEIATLGDALDFGDTNVARRNGSGCASPTRGVFGGGLTPSKISDIQIITIASKGNSIKFGDLTKKEQGSSCGSNSIRGLFNGNSPGDGDDTIQGITIASGGNAFDFGDMTAKKRYGSTPTSSTRAVFAGGYQTAINVIDSVEIATTGNAVDFGDMMMPTNGASTISDSHGGLGGY